MEYTTFYLCTKCNHREEIKFNVCNIDDHTEIKSVIDDFLSHSECKQCGARGRDIFVPRVFQQECVNACDSKEYGSYMCVLPTGAGKSYTFASQKYRGKKLFLVHRSELLNQAAKTFALFGYKVGIERGKQHGNVDDDIICSTVQTMAKRKERYQRDFFVECCVDESHRSPARQYQEIFKYFGFGKDNENRIMFSYTASPERQDGVGYFEFIDSIIYQKDILYMIQNKYLTDIECYKVNYDYNIDNIPLRSGELDDAELDKILSGHEKYVAQAYQDYRKGSTVIFCATVRQAFEISKYIDNSAVVYGNMPDNERKETLEKFSNGEIDCILNVALLVEGIDIPRIQTIIFGKPIKSVINYCQSVGRALRLFDSKEKARVVDCFCATNLSLCGAPTLIGLPIDTDVKNKVESMQGADFTKLAEELISERTNITGFIKDTKQIDVFAKQVNLDLRGINFVKKPNGKLVVNLSNNQIYEIPKIDALNNVTFDNGQTMQAQEAVDNLYRHLMQNHKSDIHLWNKKYADRWGKKKATTAQKNYLKRLKSRNIELANIDIESLNAMQASTLINQIKKE